MVVGDSVGELVTQDIIARLREIDGAPDYEFDVSNAVHEMDAQFLQVPKLPALVLRDGGRASAQGIASPNPLVTIEHSFDVIVAVPASKSGWRTDVDKLLTDVAAKLREDHTRGGLAKDTRVSGHEVWESDEHAAQTPFGAGVLTFSVIYRHLYTDPTVAY